MSAMPFSGETTLATLVARARQQRASPPPRPSRSAAPQLVAIALEAGTVSHNAAGVPFLRVVLQREPCYWRLPGAAARAWLSGAWYAATGAVAPRRSLDLAMTVLAGQGMRARRLPGPEAAAVARLSRR